MKQKPSNKSALIITTGLACNSACIMCSVKPQGVSYHDATTGEIVKDLIKGREKNYERIDFSGGEPTVRKDIFILIKQARNLGYKEIGISTNGILLGDKSFCNKLVKAGLTYITFSLHAHNEKLNEIITHTPNSFEQTVAGIKNALNYKDLAISVATAVFISNYQYLFQIGKFIHSLGVSYWDIADLMPSGFAEKKYKTLCVNCIKLSKALSCLKPLLNDFRTISFFNFSPCIMPSNILDNYKIHLISFSQKYEITNFRNYIGNVPSTNSVEKNPTGFMQKKINICRDCIYNEECAGIWTEYLRLFGDKEIKKLAIEHGCIKKSV